MFDWLINLAEQDVIVFSVFLFGLLFVALEAGYLGGRVAKRRAWVAKEATQSSGIIVGGMMTFLAFFLGMSLSIAFTGFQHRQHAVVSEANAIESAWLLAGAQSDHGGNDLQVLLRDYTAVRFKAASPASSAENLAAIARDAGALQSKAWTLATKIDGREKTYSTGLLLESLTEAFNASTLKRQAFDMRIPAHIAQLLALTASSAMLLIGFHIGLVGTRLWIPSGLLVITVVGAVALISDLSRPYHGGINVSPDALQWVLDRMQ